MSEKNWGMLGNDWAVNLLRRHIQQDALRHAYLFCGPPGVGRRTLALRFAQALNCTQPSAEGEACRTCKTCQQIDRMQYPDLMVIQSEQIGEILTKKPVQEFQYTLALKPYQGNYRIGLFLRFQEANLKVSNMLLKTLEEPPPHAILILIAGSAEQVLPTISSRCEILRLRPLPIPELQKYLLERGAPDQTARLLASLSAGKPGQALGMLANPNLSDVLEERSRALDEMGELLCSTRVVRFNFAEKLSKKKDKTLSGENIPNKEMRLKGREEMLRTLQLWASYWRDVLLLTSGADLLPLNIDRVEELHQMAGLVSMEKARQVNHQIEKATEQLFENVNTRLLLEGLLLELPTLPKNWK